jgi:glycosyltransferase involved in cell wall biosynthesis
MVFFAPPYIPMSASVSPAFGTSGAEPALDSYSIAGLPKLFADRPTKTIGALHLINGEHFSGAERVQQHLGKKLPEQAVDAHFVCLKPGKFPEMSGLPSSHVWSAPMHSRCDVSVFGQVAAIADRVKADLLHAHTPRTAMIASWVSRRTGLPWVFHVHSPTARDSTRWGINRLNDWIERFSLLNCDHIITVSKSLRREILSRGVSRFQVTCVPNGVTVQEPIDPFARINRETWKLGMVALVRPRKGIEVLLHAMAKLGHADSVHGEPRVTLDVIGPFETAEYEAQIMSMVRELGLERIVRFLGFRRDIPEVMRGLDAMVLPSLFGEGMPMVVLEAMAVGVPVIATRVEGTPEVIRHGEEGLLAEPQDPESLAQAITEFMASRSRWTEMSQRAVARQRDHFSDTHMAMMTAQVYRRIVG